jgi:ferritin-like protein
MKKQFVSILIMTILTIVLFTVSINAATAPPSDYKGISATYAVVNAEENTFRLDFKAHGTNFSTNIIVIAFEFETSIVELTKPDGDPNIETFDDTLVPMVNGNAALDSSIAGSLNNSSDAGWVSSHQIIPGSDEGGKFIITTMLRPDPSGASRFGFIQNSIPIRDGGLNLFSLYFKTLSPKTLNDINNTVFRISGSTMNGVESGGAINGVEIDPATGTVTSPVKLLIDNLEFFNIGASTNSYTITSSLVDDEDDVFDTLGSINPLGENMPFGAGTTPKFEITSAPGAVIDYLMVDGTRVNGASDKSNYTYTFEPLTRNHEISVRFKDASDITEFTVVVNSDRHGTISPSTDQTAVRNGSVTYTITAEEGYVIDSITKNGVKTADGKGLKTYTLTINDITQNYTLSVAFIEESKVELVTVTADIGANGMIDKTFPQNITKGELFSFTVMPNLGYKIESVKINGVALTIADSDKLRYTHTVPSIQANTAIAVTFMKDADQETNDYFTVSGDIGANGTIDKTLPVNVNKGESFNFTISANSGYVIKTLTINNQNITISASANKTYSYTISNIQANQKITATFAAEGGTDQSGNDNKPKPTLDKLNHFKYITGYEDGTVHPDAYITREEVATIFYRLITASDRTAYNAMPNFTDVPNDRWSALYIGTIQNAGIIKGYEDNTFKPAANITREEFATIITRFYDMPSDATHSFNDVSGRWSETYVAAAVQKGWVQGYPDGTFKPAQPITRAEAMVIINRVLERKVDKDGIIESLLPKFSDLSEIHWAYYYIVEATVSHGYDVVTDGNNAQTEKWTGSAPDLQL